MSISRRVLWTQLYSLQTALPQAAQCISARWAVREDYFSHHSQRRGWAPLCCTKPRRKSGRETQKGRETHRGKREREESVRYTGWIFPEHRCWNTLLSWPWCRVCMPTACAVPPLRPGSQSGMRTCLWGTLGWPLIQIWASFCGAARIWTASLSGLDIVIGCIVSSWVVLPCCESVPVGRVVFLWCAYMVLFLNRNLEAMFKLNAFYSLCLLNFPRKMYH